MPTAHGKVGPVVSVAGTVVPDLIEDAIAGRRSLRQCRVEHLTLASDCDKLCAKVRSV